MAPLQLLFATLLVSLYYTQSQIISTITQPCYASIGALYLNDSTGNALIIEVGNSDPGTELYNYPGFRVYIYSDSSNAYDIFFGEMISDYYGIWAESGQIFVVPSNGNAVIERGAQIEMNITLWTGTSFDNFACEFRFDGRLTLKDAAIYSTDSCPASIDGVHFSNDTAETIIIQATNNNPANELFSYPGFRVYNADDALLGQEEVDYYGISDGQLFRVNLNVTDENITLPQLGLQTILFLELWTGFYDTFSCMFEWNGTINVMTSSPTLDPTAMPTVDMNWCDDDDDESCADGTCNCAIGARCEYDVCVGWGNPNESGCDNIYVQRLSFALIFVIFNVINI